MRAKTSSRGIGWRFSLGTNRNVAVELGLVQRPDQFLRGLGNGGFGGHHLVERLEPVDCVGKWVGDNRVLLPSYLFPLFAGLAFVVFFLLAAVAFAAACVRSAAELARSSLNIVQFGIQVVQAHLDVGHALGNRDEHQPATAWLNCSSVLSIVFSTASRNGVEAVR